MRENIAITPEIIRAQSGEAAQLLTKLNKSDRSSKQARKIRRQLRKLGVSLSVHTEEQKDKRRRSDYIRDKVRERYIKKSLETPFMTKKQRRKIETRLDQVLDTAQQLVLAGYGSLYRISDRLLEIYPRIDKARAMAAAEKALGRKNMNPKLKKNPKGGITSVRRKLQQAKFRIKNMLPGHPRFREMKIRIKELREQYHKLGGTRRYNPIKNPPSGAKEIYGRIMAIEAQKGSKSNYPNEYFRHDFKKGSKIYGLRDGSILIKGKKKLWDQFET